MTQDAKQEPMITVNGKSYPVNVLPQEIKDLVAVYQLWENELGVQRREVFKSEAAMRALGNELELRFKQLEETAAAVAQAAATQAPEGPDLAG